MTAGHCYHDCTINIFFDIIISSSSIIIDCGDLIAIICYYRKKTGPFYQTLEIAIPDQILDSGTSRFTFPHVAKIEN